MTDDKLCREAFEKWWKQKSLSQNYDLPLNASSASDWDVWQTAWNTRPTPNTPMGFDKEGLQAGIIAVKDALLKGMKQQVILYDVLEDAFIKAYEAKVAIAAMGESKSVGSSATGCKPVSSESSGASPESPTTFAPRETCSEVDLKSLVITAGKAYMQSGEDQGYYSAKAMKAAIEAIRPYLRQPVSLGKCAWRVADLDNTVFKNTGENCKTIARYVLDAAGVKYGD